MTKKTVTAARLIFGAAVAGIGLIHLIAGIGVTRLFPSWPAVLPARDAWPQVAGALLGIAGALIMHRRTARGAGAFVGVVMLTSVLCLHLPRALRSDDFGDEWLNVFKWLAMAGGAFLVADSAAVPPTRVLGGFVNVIAARAKWLLGAFMLGAAILHVRFASPIAQYFIPTWIPWRLFWTYFTAGALAAGALGLLIPRTTRLAGLLTSLMIFLWCPLVHIPRTWAEPRNPGEWSGIAEALAFSAVALLLAQRAWSARPPHGLTTVRTG